MHVLRCDLELYWGYCGLQNLNLDLNCVTLSYSGDRVELIHVDSGVLHSQLVDFLMA